MQKYIMAACDLHDKTMVLWIARGREQAERWSFPNDPWGRRMMIEELRQRSAADGGAEIVFAYEASSQGFGLHDVLSEAGIRCHVLAPTRMARSPKERVSKNDARDAKAILGLLRGHVLAGNGLPAVWIPDRQTRDDRELVRARLDAASKLSKVKGQIQSLLKRHDLRRPGGTGRGWTDAFVMWLGVLSGESTGEASKLGPNARVALRSLLRQKEAMEEEIAALDQAVAALSKTARYAEAMKALLALKGVGTLTGMVFLTELGDPGRFSNRRQLACYLGLTPTSAESGRANDRKGHITRQGPSRVRRVLCQAMWAAIDSDPVLTEKYRRVVRKNPKHKKIAVVAGMRWLSIVMWHRALEAMGPPPSSMAA